MRTMNEQQKLIELILGYRVVNSDLQARLTAAEQTQAQLVARLEELQKALDEVEDAEAE